MIKAVKQLAAVLVALAMTAAPALSCCAAFAHHSHGPAQHGPSPVSADAGHAAMAAGQDHCADEMAPPAPVPDEDDGCGCSLCGDVQLTAQTSPVFPAAASVRIDPAPFAVLPWQRPDITPALMQLATPPQGPPLPPLTPIDLHTTLRL